MSQEAVRTSVGPPRETLVRGLGLLDATTLIVGSVIGSGIFIAPSIMAGHVQSPGLLMGLWIVGGLLTLFGALAYGELAAAMPHAGGQYVFLSRIFGPLPGFLYGWTLLLAINTGFIAAVAVAFAKYLGVFVPAVSEMSVLFSVGPVKFSTAQAVGLVVIAVLTWLNVTGLRSGALVQNVFTIAKVAAIAVLVVLAVVLGKGSLSNFQPIASVALGPEGVKLGLFAALAVAMSKALFSYDAWNSVTFAAEEMREPEKNLVRSLALGSVGVMIVYCAAVAVYLYMVPISEMAGIKDNRIAAEAAQRMLGGAGQAFIAVAILISTFGCVNGLILSGARVSFAMARDGHFFAAFARLNRGAVPGNALWLQAAWASLLVLSGTYSQLLKYVVSADLLLYVLLVLAVPVLRRRRPDLPRPFRAPGYPWLQVGYAAFGLALIALLLIGVPQWTWPGYAILASGVPVYFLWRREKRS